MKNITIKNWKGEEFTGEWNSKTYSPKINNDENLVRIYINNEQIHVYKDELAKISEDAEKTMLNIDIEQINRILSKYDAEEILKITNVVFANQGKIREALNNSTEAVVAYSKVYDNLETIKNNLKRKSLR